jgi:surfeit locus 1 family protein
MFRPLPILTVVSLVALALLIGLGTWQLQRRAAKHALLDQVEKRESMPPAPIEILLATGDYAAYRPATAFGRFDFAAQGLVHAPRSDGGPTRLGYKVITPFNLASGGTILVDRGWVPVEWPAQERRVPESAAEMEIEGKLRPPTPPGTFTPPGDEEMRVFYVRDSESIARAVAVTLKSTLILEATQRVGEPEPLASELNIPDNHLQYALTWFGLAIVLLVIYLRYHYLRGRLKFTR